MNKLFLTLISFITVCVLLLIWQVSQSDISVVLLPSELSATTNNKQRIRLAGRVADAKINYQVEPSLLLEFRLHDPTKSEPTIPVRYEGLKPDMFRAGRDVILDGEWKEGVFIASQLMTQCPSKYEPPKPSDQTEVTPSNMKDPNVNNL
jgi:cytochrome c-type biogenesis protein CcmE